MCLPSLTRHLLGEYDICCLFATECHNPYSVWDGCVHYQLRQIHGVQGENRFQFVRNMYLIFRDWHEPVTLLPDRQPPEPPEEHRVKCCTYRTLR